MRLTGSGFKVVAKTGGDSAESVASADISLSDAATGELIEELALDEGLRGTLVFTAQLDELIDNGDPVGEQMEVELTVPTYDAETDTPGEDWQIFSDSSGQQLGLVGFYATADGRALALSHGGEDAGQVASANLIFEEPHEGPAPLETEVDLSLVSQAEKWVQKGDAGVPEDYTLTTSLVTPEGEVLDSSTATGGGTGTVYKSSGQSGSSGVTKRRTKGGFVVDIRAIGE